MASRPVLPRAGFRITFSTAMMQSEESGKFRAASAFDHNQGSSLRLLGQLKVQL